MKKNLLILLMILPAGAEAVAQNLQLHYDFSEERRYFTATLEMFRPDRLGSTFWFVDLDFDFPGSPRSMSAAYWEISRDFYIPGLRKIHPFEEVGFHLEYNDGFTAYQDTSHYIAAASYNSVFLTGFSFPVPMGETTVTAQLLGRFPRGMDVPDFQFTLVWTRFMLQERILFTGFADLWSQDRITEPDRKELVFQAEPQLWYLITTKIGVGGEIEISRNFPAGPNEWEFRPTLGFRWEF